jgi:hypothetical protein
MKQKPHNRYPFLLTLPLLFAATAFSGISIAQQDQQQQDQKQIAPLTSESKHVPSDELPNNFQTPEDVKKEIRFLTQGLAYDGSGEFQTIKGRMARSYLFNNSDYLGKYICEFKDRFIENPNCNVVDVESYREPSIYSILPNAKSLENKSGILQMERVLSSLGTITYDAATWQIAVALAAHNNLFDKEEAKILVNNQVSRLNKFDSRAAAYIKGEGYEFGFRYGYGETASIIKNPLYSYAFRMVGPNFVVDDPLKNTAYQSYISDEHGGRLNKQVTWADWLPLTGENAWAFITGPLQSMYLLGEKVDAHSPALRTAIRILWAMQRMQSPIGAFYYATNGANGNDGKPVPEGLIAVEHNVSSLGALTILQKTIQSIPNWLNNPELTAANNVINIMLFGGNMPQGGTTSGILSFLKNHAWDQEKQYFILGGAYKKGKFEANRTFAVDSNSWGLLALGPKTVDSWFGKGMSYTVWQNTRTAGGYLGSDGKLWGVGFIQEEPGKQVLSGEWTAGAISAVHMLIDYYEKNGGLTESQLASLKADQQNMLEHLLYLRSDLYNQNKFKDGGIDANYLTKVPEGQLGVFYTNRRYYITFGWYANPVPYTASTAWTVMLSYWFNPFGYQGSMISPDFSTTPTYDPTKHSLYANLDTATILNYGVYNKKAREIVVARENPSSPNDWITLGKIPANGFASFDIPENTPRLMMAINTDKPEWPKMCMVDWKKRRAFYADKSPLNTAIIAKWRGIDGTGQCPDLADVIKNTPVKVINQGVDGGSNPKEIAVVRSDNPSDPDSWITVRKIGARDSAVVEIPEGTAELIMVLNNGSPQWPRICRVDWSHYTPGTTIIAKWSGSGGEGPCGTAK